MIVFLQVPLTQHKGFLHHVSLVDTTVVQTKRLHVAESLDCLFISLCIFQDTKTNDRHRALKGMAVGVNLTFPELKFMKDIPTNK